MALRHYPKEIEELMKIWEPYKDKVKDGIMKDAPKEAIEAFKKFKKWAWEQKVLVSFQKSKNLIGKVVYIDHYFIKSCCFHLRVQRRQGVHPFRRQGHRPAHPVGELRRAGHLP